MKKYSKEHIRLWFEYLRRSCDFQELSAWYRESLDSGNPRSYPFPKKFKNDNGYHPILWKYGLEGFVEAEAKGWTFETLWQMRGDLLPNTLLSRLKKVRPTKTVEGLAEFLEKNSFFSLRNYEKTVEDLSKKFENNNNTFLSIEDHEWWAAREVHTAKDYRQHCIDAATHYLPDHVVVNLGSTTLTQIRRMLSKFMKEKANRSISLKKARLYLEVFDLRQASVNYKDIIKQLGTEEQKAYGYSPDDERQFRRYYNKALKILENTENGIFP
jgi:hypothetical protein